MGGPAVPCSPPRARRCSPVSHPRVDVSEDGMKALVTLSSGDMRRALNILQVPLCHHRPHSWPTGRELFLPPPLPQSTSMAFGKVTEENVYTCTGHPLEADITNILDWMLNQNFSTAFRSILCPSALGLSPVAITAPLCLLLWQG